MYSKEDGTPAARLKDQVHHMTKKSRHGKLMKEQKEISKENLEQKIGNTYEVLIEHLSFDRRYYIGRTYMDVPEEDGVIFVKNDREICIGSFVNCRVSSVRDYDLIGEIL